MSEKKEGRRERNSKVAKRKGRGDTNAGKVRKSWEIEVE